MICFTVASDINSFHENVKTKLYFKHNYILYLLPVTQSQNNTSNNNSNFIQIRKNVTQKWNI